MPSLAKNSTNPSSPLETAAAARRRREAEDREDYRDAVKAKREAEEKGTTSLEVLAKELGL